MQRHLDDVENLDLQQSLDLILTPELFDEPVNNYYHQLSASDYKDLFPMMYLQVSHSSIEHILATIRKSWSNLDMNDTLQSSHGSINASTNKTLQSTGSFLFFCTIWYLLAVLSWDTKLHFYTSNFYLNPVLTVIKILFMMLLSIPQC